MAGDKLPEMCNRGETKKDSSRDHERETRLCKKLSHSIEEILRRPACVRRETTGHHNWSVIKGNTKANQHLFRGMFSLLLLLVFLFKK